MGRIGPNLLASLFDAHAAALALYARQWCDGPEDIVQEAFVKLARQRPPPDRAVPWLYRVVRNGAIEASEALGAGGVARPWPRAASRGSPRPTSGSTPRTPRGSWPSSNRRSAR